MPNVNARANPSRRRAAAAVRAAVLALLAPLAATLAGLACSGCASSAGGQALAIEPPSKEEESSAPLRFFSARSVWNVPLSATAPLDPSSGELVGALSAEAAREQQARTGPWLNTTSFSVPIYEVSRSQPTVKVTLARPASSSNRSLRRAWRAVPLPASAAPAAGGDMTLVVWQPSEDRMWEFWRLRRAGGAWLASWGGAIRHVSSDPGVYERHAWPGARRSWGVSAGSFAIAGGLITFRDLARGEIDHALAISLPNVRAGIFAAPAERTDGTSHSPLSLPEGAHLRLNPQLDLDALHLAPLTLMIARAAQRYGIVVRDRSPNIAFYAQDPPPGAKNPYTGPGGYLQGSYPSEMLATFPWSELELLSMDLHETA